MKEGAGRRIRPLLFRGGPAGGAGGGAGEDLRPLLIGQGVTAGVNIWLRLRKGQMVHF